MTFTDGVILMVVTIIVGLLVWYLAKAKANGGSCASCNLRSSKRFSNRKSQTRMVDAYHETYHNH